MDRREVVARSSLTENRIHSIIDSLAGNVKLEDMPKFSIKDVLIATLLISLSTRSVWQFFLTLHHLSKDSPPTSTIGMVELWAAGGLLVGAGLGAIFKRPLSGAILGLGVQFLLASVI